MEFQVLGPVEALVAGHPVGVGRPQQRAVLAALVVDAPRVVPVDVLVDRVWGDTPPDRARRTLHTHIAKIRRLLETAGAAGDPVGSLVHRSGGYSLDIDPGRVDLHRFRFLSEQGRDPARDVPERVGLLREALGLWRGEALAGLGTPWATAVRERLRQQRLDVVVAWARTEVQNGNPGAVVGPVAELVAAHPLVEPLVAELMRALHAAGRTAEALSCYAAARQRLVAELGVEPGAALRAMHQQVLRDGPDLDSAAPPPARASEPNVTTERNPATQRNPATAGPTATGPDATTSNPAPATGPATAPDRAPATAATPDPATRDPAQLPRDVHRFSGRRATHAALDAVLARAGGRPTTVVISGTAGVGKTAAAVHWAHRVRPRFPDGQLYVNLRGFHPGGIPVTPAEAVRGFLAALNVPARGIPADQDAQVGLFGSVLADRRVLIVLDNARDAEQVRPLLPGAAGCLVVVTSRNQLTGLIATEGAHPLTLDLLTVDEARDLLAHRLGPERMAAEPRPVDQFISVSSRLPLALVIMAARAAAHPTFPLAVLADDLGDTDSHLDAFAGQDTVTDIRAVFSWSYQAVSANAARLFRLLAMHPGPDISAPAAAGLAGLPPRRVRTLLAELTDAHLLNEHVSGRYVFHDLLRAYATEQAATYDSAADRRGAVHRVLDHYVWTARTAAVLIHPGRPAIPLDAPRPGVTPEQLSDYEGALTWFNVESPVLVAAVKEAAAAGFDTHTWQLASAASTYFQRTGYWPDGIVLQRTALAAAQRVGDLAAQAHACRALGFAYASLGRYGDAWPHHQHALDLFIRVGDLLGQARSYFTLGRLLELEDRHAEAFDHARRALDLYRAAGDASGQAYALNAIGWCQTRRGDHLAAIDSCRQAQALHREAGERFGEASAWDSLGYAHHQLADHPRATACYQRAITLYDELGARYEAATSLINLGDTHQAAGDRDAARQAWSHALRMLGELTHPDADRARSKLQQLTSPATG
ncbi:MAG TPA: BTAD domain-containing putative transcriptional regulator [Catenuloplanes sp.]